MITNSKDEITCTCDECGCEQDAGTMEFKTFIKYLKEQGWRIFKEDEDSKWEHWCQDCKLANGY